MTACLKEGASACIGMVTRLGLGRLEHVEIKHFALQHWVRQGTINSVFFGSEKWLDEMCNRSLNLRIRANGLAMLARLSHQLQ